LMLSRRGAVVLGDLVCSGSIWGGGAGRGGRCGLLGGGWGSDAALHNLRWLACAYLSGSRGGGGWEGGGGGGGGVGGKIEDGVGGGFLELCWDRGERGRRKGGREGGGVGSLSLFVSVYFFFVWVLSFFFFGRRFAIVFRSALSSIPFWWAGSAGALCRSAGVHRTLRAGEWRRRGKARDGIRSAMRTRLAGRSASNVGMWGAMSAQIGHGWWGGGL